MIVAPQPLAAEEGLGILRQGGNAVDAAVTAALIQGVIDPQMCGIGGGGVMLVRNPSRSSVTAIEFYPCAGSLVTEDMWVDSIVSHASALRYAVTGSVNDYGYPSIAVPGTVRGFSVALERFGTISWRQALGPAIALARGGFPVSGFMREYWESDPGPGCLPHHRRIQATPEARRIFTDEGRLYEVGARLVQADLALTLERLADDPDVFYRGDLAATVAADLEANGASITAADLEAYSVDVTEPLTGTYRGRAIVTAGPPGGGVALLQMLNAVEAHDIAALGWPSVDAAILWASAINWAMADQHDHLADPQFTPVPVRHLTDKARAKVGGLEPGGPTEVGFVDAPTTTHVNVIDDDGMAVSLTHTLGSSSGVVTPGLGFVYNNYLSGFDPRPGRGNSLAPGKRRATMMAPTFVFEDDRLAVLAGAPGGTRIASGIAQVLSNVLDHGMRPVEAVSAPRLHCDRNTVHAEGRLPKWVLHGLETAGFRVERRVKNYDFFFSLVQLLTVGPDAVLRGAADPRGDGGVALEPDGREP